MKTCIINRSAWPTPALKVLCGWLLTNAAFDSGQVPYTFVFRSTRTIHTWRGRGSSHGQTITLSRRFQPREGWPWRLRDHRFKWACEEVYRSRLEVLVGLMGHELEHAMEGRPQRFLTNGRIDRARMEFHCNQAGQRAVEALRRDWPVLRTRIKRALHDERRHRSAAKLASHARCHDPERKLVHAQQKLKQWGARLKLAQTKVRRYRRQVAYYERRAAAKGPGTAIRDSAAWPPPFGAEAASRPDVDSAT